MEFSLFKKKTVDPKINEVPPMFGKEAPMPDFSFPQGMPRAEEIPEPPRNPFMENSQMAQQQGLRAPEKDARIFDKFADEQFYPDSKFDFGMPRQNIPVIGQEGNQENQNLAFPGQKESEELFQRFLAQEKANTENKAPEFTPDLMGADVRKEIDTGKPIFIKIDKYKSIIRELSNIRALIRNANSSINSLHSLKESEDAELEEWRAKIEDLERKLIYVDDSLFGSL
jgi:hypothetical protein